MSDDARSQAIEVAARGIPNQYVDSDRMCHKIAEGCIDDALASGHVRLTDPSEPNISVEAYWAASVERDEAEARVENLWEAINIALDELARGRVERARSCLVAVLEERDNE